MLDLRRRNMLILVATFVRTARNLELGLACPSLKRPTLPAHLF
ncbi:hypothetical protein HMPREF1978_01843 [Actinomyces graevenitzii F0530]|uniref:Uncharacterized protein n=1 Tax=Actinomyces graevenitzii F0530 TaxID=1321817 RepID=U1PW34_9ACTO|nr:hypothetical protein HMPREF1978_01843 [Actinomyces graevenitzii F0530]